MVAQRHQDANPQRIVPLGAVAEATAESEARPVVPKARTRPKPGAAAAVSYASLLTRWETKLRTGLGRRSLPPSLLPLDDHLDNVATPCDKYRLEIVRHEQECAWGNPRARNVVAITGDSHAGMWLRTLQGSLDPDEWRLYPFTRAWCGWAGGSEGIGADVASLNKDCDDLQAQTLREMKRLQVDVVVLSETGVRPAGVYAAALESYSRLGARVVVMGHTPVVVPNFTKCLRGDADISECRGALSSKDFTAVDLERSQAVQFGAVYVDTTPWFCVDLDCPSVIDGAPTYTDGSHISAELAPKLVPLLRQSLREAGVVKE